MKLIKLEATKRKETGKGHCKKYRKEGLMPSIIYGQGENINILINNKIFNKISSGITKSTVIDLKLGKKEYHVLIKDYEKNYIKNEFLHIDFYELKAGKPVHFRIPFNFVGNAIGIKEGGILEKHLVDLEIECLPKDIVSCFDVNIEKMCINDTLHVTDIDLDKKYKVLSHPDEVVVHISGKMIEEEEEKKEEEVEGVVEEKAATEAE